MFKICFFNIFVIKEMQAYDKNLNIGNLNMTLKIKVLLYGINSFLYFISYIFFFKYFSFLDHTYSTWKFPG